MLVKKLKEGILGVLFPDICSVCGLKLSDHEHAVCTSCLNEKFEEAWSRKSFSSSGVLLPEGITIQHALWNFDKGGHLQELLHQLKYCQRCVGGDGFAYHKAGCCFEKQEYEHADRLFDREKAEKYRRSF